MRIVVVGGTGTAGAAIVRALARRGAEPVPLSRSGRAIAGAIGVKADIVSGEGLGDALEGAEAVVDASNSRNPLDQRPFTTGARNVVAAATEAGVERAVVLSILGVDRSRLTYHRKKLEQEQIYESSPLRTTVVRAAQFHEWSVDMFEAGAPLGAIPVLLGGRLQPVDVGEVAALCAEEAIAPSGTSPIDFAGPEVRVSRDLARAWQSATGARGHIVNGPFPPSMLDYVRSGANLTESRKGRITFEEWLARRR